jgi:hypothetical protein
MPPDLRQGCGCGLFENDRKAMALKSSHSTVGGLVL